MDTTENTTPADKDVSRTVLTQLIGLGAYAALSAQTRLAKDGDQAPRPFERVDMARMSAAAWTAFEDVTKRATREHIDVLEAIAPYDGLLDDLDARTRPTTWWERMTKTYVAMGVFTDALREIASLAGEDEFGESVSDFGHADWVRERLAPATAEDAQLRARLSLWTRRVGGEALGLVHAFFYTNTDIVADDTDTAETMQRITARHQERLAAVHLQA